MMSCLKEEINKKGDDRDERNKRTYQTPLFKWDSNAYNYKGKNVFMRYINQSLEYPPRKALELPEGEEWDALRLLGRRSLPKL